MKNEYLDCSQCRYDGKEGCYLRNIEKMLKMIIKAEGCTKGERKDG